MRDGTTGKGACARPDEPNLLPGTHMMERENQLPHVHHSICKVCVEPPANKQIDVKSSGQSRVALHPAGWPSIQQRKGSPPECGLFKAPLET